MLGLIENANILSSFHQQHKLYGKIQNRKSHAFLFKISGSMDYNFGDKQMTLKQNQVIFLPQGSSYEYTCQEKDVGLYTSINFYANVENPTPCIFSTNDFYQMSYIHQSFSDAWRFGATPDKYKCLSVFYDFLSYLARLEHLSSLDKHKHYIIEPAIEYLKTHLFNSNLKIDNLAKLCCISDTYFRKLFVSKFSVSPQDYVINKRITHAKAILESGDYDSIAEVSELVGYSDPLYFSKAFKKIYGFSPSNINQ